MEPEGIEMLSSSSLLLRATIGALTLALWSLPLNAADLKITLGGKTHTITTSQLLARRDVETITVPVDVAYKRKMSYKAVPLMVVLSALGKIDFDTLEARATDGFVSQLPMSLVSKATRGAAIAWIAIEPTGQPWPKIPKKTISAGPFYLIWQFPERSGIGPEQWPYALAELRGVRSPMQRWPQMVVRSSGKRYAAARRGLVVYVKHCLACHRIAGAGEATMGPDLALPMSPTAYMTDAGLRALIRDPAAVRAWPNQQMQGFTLKVLPNAQLNELMAYLRYMARHSRRRARTK